MKFPKSKTSNNTHKEGGFGGGVTGCEFYATFADYRKKLQL